MKIYKRSCINLPLVFSLLSIENQPQNPEFRNYPENPQPCGMTWLFRQIWDFFFVLFLFWFDMHWLMNVCFNVPPTAMVIWR